MPTTEFRSIPPDRLDEYQAITDYAFSPEDGAPEPEDARELTDQPGDRYGVFVDDDIQSVCKHYDFEARLRDAWVPLVGLAAVATPPEHRRQGHVTRIVETSLDRWRGEYPLTALWPFDREFYRQFGWATANTFVKYTCSPETLATAGRRTDGQLTRVTADDWATLQDAHESHAADRTLTLRRDEDWWREKVFHESGDGPPHAYALERDGTAVGYVFYEAERTGDGLTDRRVTVQDLAFTDELAYRRLLGFLADHDSQAEEVVFYREAESTLLDAVDDPSDVTCEVSAGPMVRVVDVPTALEAVPYPPDATADLTLDVADETAPWDHGMVRLTVADGDGECVRVEDGGEADVAIDVGTLSQLVVGYRDVTALRRVGSLEVADEATAATLAACFPAETVYLRQFF